MQFWQQKGQRTDMYAWSLKFCNTKQINKNNIMDGQWNLADSVCCVNMNEKLKVHDVKTGLNEDES